MHFSVQSEFKLVVFDHSLVGECKREEIVEILGEHKETKKILKRKISWPRQRKIFIKTPDEDKTKSK